MTLHFFHVIGFLHVIVSLLQGWTTNFIPNQRFSPEILLQCIRDQKPNLLIIGSHHYVQLSEADKSSFAGFDPKGLESVKIIMPTGMFAKSLFQMAGNEIFCFVSVSTRGCKKFKQFSTSSIKLTWSLQ